MSKRAEEAARKAYPPTYTTVKRHAKRVQSELVDTHKPVRAIFQQGYEQAEKDLTPAFEFSFDVPNNDGHIVFTPMDNMTIRKELKLKKGERVIVSIMKKNKLVLPADMDKECIALCEALNELPHTETEESCCGHLKSPFRIWLRCSSFTYLAIVARAIDRRYSGTQKEWRLISETADQHPRFSFMLTSVEPYGTYEEMITDTNRIIANIRYWRENFLEYFQSDGEVTNPGENLALTVKDLELLHTFLYAVKNNKFGCFTFTRLAKEQYEEVLRRFNEQKKK